MFLKEILLVSCLIGLIRCHGWIEDPPSRNARAFMPEMNCGTFMRQWYYNAGNCGVCGDDFSGNQPHITTASRQFRVSRTYTAGDIIDVKYRITAHHFGGLHEFKICAKTSLTQEVTQECLDANPLEIVAGQRESIPADPYKGIVAMQDTLFNVRVKLPDGFTCDHCTFQWTWAVNNTKGVLPDGRSVHGYGARETFRNCADISIRRNPNAPLAVFVPKAYKPAHELFLMTQEAPVIFTCATFGPAPPRNPNPDPFLYTGSGLVCYHLERNNQNCELCRLSCSTPDKVCPSICQCRWYGPQKRSLLNVSTTTTTTTTTTTPIITTSTRSTTSARPTIATTTTAEPSPNLVGELQGCNGSIGFLRHPTSCSRFLLCYGSMSQVMSCPPGYLFEETLKICDVSSKVRCSVPI